MRQPVLFVSHGAPSLVLEDTPTRRFLLELGQELPRPKAILCVTAHWETAAVAVSQSPAPEMIYDFGGFSPELYQVQYPAPGEPALAARVVQLLRPLDGLAMATERGYDHGVWSPLKLLFPAADVPVVSMAVQPRRSAAEHVRLGEALAGLREEGVLILGSGSTTHNLRELDWRGTAGPRPHAAEFEQWLVERVLDNRVSELAAWQTEGPEAARSHPTPEHLLPLFVALGAGQGSAAQVLNRRFEYGSLSMAAFRWDELG